jgi:hypothetical protein
LLALAALLLLAGAGCSSPTGPELQLRLAYVTEDGTPPVVDLVTMSDRTVEIVFDTFGAGCHRAGDTRVVLDGMAAIVTPYDYRPPVGTTCTRNRVFFRHSAVIEFPRNGSGSIVVQGLSDEIGPSAFRVVSFSFDVSVQ